jgi:hypothetical protein
MTRTIKPEIASRRIALSIVDVMAEGGFCRDFVYREIRAGRLVARKAGRRTIVLRPDWQAYLASLPRMAATSSEAAAS